MISFLPLQSGENYQTTNNSEITQARKLKREQKKEEARLKAAAADQKSREQRKREIEEREKSVNKNKKVKKFSTDEDLPKTVRKRNIP